MDFYELSHINYIYFSKLGSFEKLQSAVGKAPDEHWSDDEMADFRSLYLLFKSEYISHGGDELKHITPGDSFLSFITLYGYKELLAKSDNEIKKLISLNYTEFELMSKKRCV